MISAVVRKYHKRRKYDTLTFILPYCNQS